jgi:putative membrane protein
MRLTEEDHRLVAEAVAAAEARTDGEIVTVVAQRSDAYHDVALHWAVLAMLAVPALLATFPHVAERWWALIDPWTARTPTSGLFLVALVLSALAFLIVRVALAPMGARMALTPGATKARRVRRRALELFRASAERRTKGRTGVLICLSLAEHRAELIADEAIHSRVAPELWGDAMAALIERTRAGRPGEGIATAVEMVGRVLHEHFPRTDGDTNELPDRLVEL